MLDDTDTGTGNTSGARAGVIMAVIMVLGFAGGLFAVGWWLFGGDATSGAESPRPSLSDGDWPPSQAFPVTSFVILGLALPPLVAAILVQRRRRKR